MENQAERTFEDYTKEEKMLILALYVTHPMPQDTDQIRRTITANGWDKLTNEELNSLRITLVKSKYN